MEFAEGSVARPMVSIVFGKECVPTQDKAYRDEVLSSPLNTIGCKDFLSVSFHTKDNFFPPFTPILHCKECDISLLWFSWIHIALSIPQSYPKSINLIIQVLVSSLRKKKKMHNYYR